MVEAKSDKTTATVWTMSIEINNVMVLLDLSSHEDGTLCISFHAFTRQIIPSTLKLPNNIKGENIMVLIDDGSNNKFIQSLIATHLGFTVNSLLHL